MKKQIEKTITVNEVEVGTKVKNVFSETGYDVVESINESATMRTFFYVGKHERMNGKRLGTRMKRELKKTGEQTIEIIEEVEVQEEVVQEENTAPVLPKEMQIEDLNREIRRIDQFPTYAEKDIARQQKKFNKTGMEKHLKEIQLIRRDLKNNEEKRERLVAKLAELQK
jgi:hypothetical protein